MVRWPGALVALASSCAWAQDGAATGGGVPAGATTSDATTSNATGVDAPAAMALRRDDTRMTVAVTIDGAGPFRFLVDSGATRTVVSSRLAALLRLPPAGVLRFHTVGGAASAPAVRIAALGVGALPPRAIAAPVLDEANIGAAGILGIDALAGRKVVMDIAARRMTVSAGDRRVARAGEDEIVVTARRRDGQLVLVDADAAGQRVWAVVDTGGMMTLGNGVLRDRLVRRRRASPADTVITDVVGNRIAVTAAAVSGIRIGGFRLTGPVIAFADAHAFSRFGLADRPAMLLGMDLLRSFRTVSIDYRRGTVRLARRPEGA